MTALDRLSRHLRGWQLAVAAVGTALGGVALALPRPVAPVELPLPDVDRGEERLAEQRIRELVSWATAEPLPFLVRAAGETFRRFGGAEAKGETSEAAVLATDFARRVSEARARHGDRAVLALRAVQGDLFLRAVRTGDARERAELGGALFGGDRFVVPKMSMLPDELAVLFELRWTKLAGLVGTYPFSPTLNDWRLYYRAVLGNPDLATRSAGAGFAVLSKSIDALAKRTPEYPRSLALGIVQHWMGRYEAAEELYISYLAREPSGPFRLRAQNYMLAARQRVPASPRP